MTLSDRSTAQDTLEATQRTQIRRIPQRGDYDRETIDRILDEGLICHVGFVVDGQPFVIPTSYGRMGDCLYIHGSPASRMLRSLSGGIEVCVTVTLLDGLVLARSAFHHSMNYRSVVLFGTATLVQDFEDKQAALKAFTEHIIPGRWAEVRSPNRAEVQGTTVLSLPLHEASAKVRTGPPIDDEADYNIPVWAGVLPLELQTTAPIADPQLTSEMPIPEYIRGYSRRSVVSNKTP
ncbi:pyridoxamine 5'-phosphate oxidase family protein [Desertifilum sp. FACHB-1129]|uniref:Flavin-nucleotide-binding protein n=1 Tax=Desertifilum tharense IPPAS B-1220 TaxID=1781255 RepID=A0A1E5QQ93_9CYAN|nr:MULTISPECIES: pyridoxamine 5'-phosphate oxidase family protein [unclassified Desertifilum]MDA0211037.1 pyridoxamine 5'-phosphate oxidase family protein [Cyanobacteria bacterium FC1]OEJ76503.1 flavin-nucleotide-binding protein [Desertifilum tharense IPPAS B-1220]MBD2312709.1 pyridoxamine 5'-phosphate oxidase family protein [Desertifilum sp. FACHB-1129]MBD2320190.1 pyridoxamine 5'-phosphate oxidase family protein [Desertifilum sp. FACHB-866]MBD2330318.1 pyridoxamine 5'-phosphate oxidase famil